ncbi:MAG: hypothetical protein GY827_09665 [Cytophagales bacterium]|nr:hypothetical protein [Cytophagales bacterium]
MAKHKEWIKRLRNKEDLKIGIICILAAATFWFFNAMNANYSTTISYPFEVIYNPEKITQIQDFDPYIKINISGDGWNLLSKELGFKSQPCIIKIADPKQDKQLSNHQLHTLFSSKINNDNIHLNYVEDDYIKLPFDWIKKRTIQLKVQPNFQKENYELGTVQLSNHQIEITGAQQFIDDLKDTLVLKIPQLDEGNTINEQEVSLTNYFYENMKLNHEFVTVTAKVHHYEQHIIEVPISILDGEEKNVYAQKLKVQCRVREDSIKYLSADIFDIVADMEKKNKDGNCPIEIISKPSFITIDNIFPKQIKMVEE